MELAKCYIKLAFCLDLVHLAYFELMDFTSKSQFYGDRDCLPMDGLVTWAAFESFSSFLERALLNSMELTSMAQHFNDFLFACEKGTGHCDFLLFVFLQLVGSSWAKKTAGLSPDLTFLGTEIDTDRKLFWLPAGKLDSLHILIDAFYVNKKITLLESQQLASHISFACKVMGLGRAFIRKLCYAMATFHLPQQKRKFTRVIKENLSLWKEFFASYNGISFWQKDIVVAMEL